MGRKRGGMLWERKGEEGGEEKRRGSEKMEGGTEDRAIRTDPPHFSLIGIITS